MRPFTAPKEISSKGAGNLPEAPKSANGISSGFWAFRIRRAGSTDGCGADGFQLFPSDIKVADFVFVRGEFGLDFGGAMAVLAVKVGIEEQSFGVGDFLFGGGDGRFHAFEFF